MKELSPVKKIIFTAIVVSGFLVIVVLISITLIANWRQQRDSLTYFRKTLSENIANKYPQITEEDRKRYIANWSAISSLVPIPYVGANYLPNVRGEFVNTNDLGFRGTVNFLDMVAEAEKIHSAGGKVVIFTGGSAAFGSHSINDETCIVGYLNYFSESLGSPLVVFNFGMGSYTSDQELAVLVMYASELSPDYLIVMDGYNDSLRVSHPGYNAGIKVPYAYERIRDAYPVKFHSSFLDAKSTVKDIDKVLAVYGDNLRKMNLFMKTIGGKAMFITQPIRAKQGKPLHCPDFQDYMKKVAEVYPQFIHTARTVAKEQKTEYIDMSAIFNDHPDPCVFFSDSVHMTSEGQLIVAEEIFLLMVRDLGLEYK